jgi:hypothetical protein
MKLLTYSFYDMYLIINKLHGMDEIVTWMKWMYGLHSHMITLV